MMFQKGQQVSWLHGEHHRVATVIEVENERVIEAKKVAKALSSRISREKSTK